ncbi:protein crossbronx [Favolaschia claudopus]|uniref:Protein crossbronx n=1 Tax=Favolaschia claudopus TaxID=2862362 RepID=A0AAW0EBW2_9AGAR
MTEVIDLTLDSPGPSDADNKQTRRKERRAERRQKKRDSKEKQRDDSPDRRDRHHDRHRDDDRPRERDRDHDHGSTRKERSSHRSRDERRDTDHGKRRRDSSRETDRKRSRRDRSTERDSRIPNEELYVVDKAPASLPAAARYAPAAPVEEPDLVLPPHVSIFGDTPDPILPTEPVDSDEDDDYIEYLDYDNRKDFVRYYEEQPEENEKRMIICKKCGDEGHIAAACVTLICLTCGARDDHATFRCKSSKNCFRCGMRGHLIDECPNQRAAMSGVCERCFSTSHLTTECPLLWRVYVYVEEEEHERILKSRKERMGIALGQGGEGYIARDACCYNCGESGHWGDDCREFYHSEEIVEPTAFSHYWLTQGPFTIEEQTSRPLRDWRSDIPLPGGVENVGRQAKKKEMEKLARRQQQDEDDDANDWFQNMGKKPERERRPSGNIPTGPRKMTLPSKPRAMPIASSSKISLTDRLSDRPPPDRPAKDRNRASESKYRNDRDTGREDRHRDRNKDRGPRYTGGMYVVPSPENFLVWDAVFFVHQGYYADAILKFRLTFPNNYPESPPVVQFVTDVVSHPLISHSGIFNLAPRFRPWRPKEHRVFDILHYIKAAFKKHALDEIKESDCLNKEAYRLYHETTSSFAGLASQSSLLSQSAPALFDRDHPTLKGKPKDALPFRELAPDQLQTMRAKLGLKEWQQEPQQG